MNKHARALSKLLQEVGQTEGAKLMLEAMDEPMTAKDLSAMERRIRSWVNEETKSVRCPGWAPVILGLALKEKRK